MTVLGFFTALMMSVVPVVRPFTAELGRVARVLPAPIRVPVGSVIAPVAAAKPLLMTVFACSGKLAALLRVEPTAPRGLDEAALS